ncbi:hypothetical protein Tco_0736920 [Tanacetum coccineum]
MTAIKETRKMRALEDLRIRALKCKPLKKSEVTQLMRNLVKNQWCAAHNGTITMTAVKAMTKQQLIEEYDFMLIVLPANVSTGHIPIDVLLESTSGGINEFFLTSDAEEQIGMSRVAVDPDSDDEVLAEILFRGKYISGAGVVVVDKLPDDEIVDPRVKVETGYDYASSPPRSRRKHRGVRRDDFLWDKPVEDFFSCRVWKLNENRRQKSFLYLKQLLPHVYREDLLLLRRRMNRYFRLNPDVDVGLDLWRDVNLLCQSLHSDDVEDFWRTQDEWIVCSWKLYPKSSVHVLDLTNGKTVYMFVDKDGLRQAYECLASAPISPWLTAKKESGSPLQTALVCNSNPLIALLYFDDATSFDYAVHRVHVVSFDAAVSDAAASVSAACIIAAGYIVSAVVSADSSSSFPADYVSAGHVLVSADRDRIC